MTMTIIIESKCQVAIAGHGIEDVGYLAWIHYI